LDTVAPALPKLFTNIEPESRFVGPSYVFAPYKYSGATAVVTAVPLIFTPAPAAPEFEITPDTVTKSIPVVGLSTT
jgi:hypothetical protein